MIVLSFIFIYAQSSVHRVQPIVTDGSNVTNSVIVQTEQISRQEIALLKRMAFTFVMFISGWSPIFVVFVMTAFIFVHPIIYQSSIVVSQLSVLSVIINIFKCNHELRQYLWGKMQCCKYFT
jgi:hypothetical protein